MGVTINDVAKKAGVSHTTVSWVIHDDKRITDETKQKVLKAIKELNYHPNYSARSLKRGKTNTIAIVASFFSSSFETGILKGIELGMDINSFDYNINQYSTRGRKDIKEQIFKNILYSKRADAVISINILPDPEILKAYKEEKMPVVLVEEEMNGAHAIKTDNFKGAYIATEHLLKKGKKDIILVVGEVAGEEVGLSPVERLNGYKAALKDNGIDFDKENVYEIYNYYFEEGEAALRQILEDKNKCDAIFCAAGDMVAMGIMEQARKLDIKIPNDLSIIGYDDIHTASLISPSLTTIKQPIVDIGRETIKLTVKSLTETLEKDELIIFQPELILRDSC